MSATCSHSCTRRAGSARGEVRGSVPGGPAGVLDVASAPAAAGGGGSVPGGASGAGVWPGERLVLLRGPGGDVDGVLVGDGVRAGAGQRGADGDGVGFPTRSACRFHADRFLIFRDEPDLPAGACWRHRTSGCGTGWLRERPGRRASRSRAWTRPPGSGRGSCCHLQGGSESGITADHHVRVSVNGGFVGEATFTGKQPHRLEVSVPASLLQGGGERMLSVANVGDTGVSSLVFLDRFETSYPQAATVRQGVFEAVWGESGTVEVSGLSGAPVILRDTGLPGPEGSAVKWVVGFATTPGSVRFQAEAGHRYLVVSPGRAALAADRTGAALDAQGGDEPGGLPGDRPAGVPGGGAALLERRRSQGLVSQAVSFEEIASEFGRGQPSAEAIKAFLSHAYHSWQRPSLRYVLLLGDATYDPRRFLADVVGVSPSGPRAKTELSVDGVGPGAWGGERGGSPSRPFDWAASRDDSGAGGGSGWEALTWEDSGPGSLGQRCSRGGHPGPRGRLRGGRGGRPGELPLREEHEDAQGEGAWGRHSSRHPRLVRRGGVADELRGHGGRRCGVGENVLSSWDTRLFGRRAASRCF